MERRNEKWRIKYLHYVIFFFFFFEWKKDSNENETILK